MTESQLKNMIASFKIDGEIVSCVPYGDGHINDTYLLTTTEQKYILQKINTSIFSDVDLLMNNINYVLDFMREKITAYGGNPDRETMTLVPTVDGKTYYMLGNDAYRTYIYIDDTISLSKAENEEHFYQSGVGFGRFARLLDGFDASKIKDVIPFFHDTPVRYEAFIKAVEADAFGRKKEVEKEIEFVKARRGFMDKIVKALALGEIPTRVTHNDTKLNNVLLDKESGKAVAVIDLDTVMQGSVCYDFGDSVRFGCSTATEDEVDLDKVHFSLSLFDVYCRGFIGEMKSVLTQKEAELLPIGSIMMTLECGMRFLTDYLSGDTYFKIHREKHNLDRCRTQFKLVAEMEEALEKMHDTVEKYFN